MQGTARALALCAGLGLCSAVQASVIVAQWNFNEGSFKHSFSRNGAYLSTVGSGVKLSLVSQSGSSDTTGGSKPQAMNTTGYAAQGTGDQQSGVQFMINTMGYEHLRFSWDQQNSATASAYSALLYTLDGGDNWLFGDTFLMKAAGSFVRNISFDLGLIDGAANNEDFGIRLVSTFKPGSNGYVATGGGSYGTAGTMRYDLVTLSGDEIPEPPAPALPEPSSLALLAGAALAFTWLRRKPGRPGTAAL